MEFTPECFSSQADWLAYCEQARSAEVSISPRRFTRDFVLSRACADCTVSYQLFAMLRGRCRPPDRIERFDTPSQRVRTPVVRVKENINDWADDELLPMMPAVPHAV